MPAPRFLVLTMAALLVIAGNTARGEDPGQEQLNQAIEARLSAKSLLDLSGVIDLCQQAIAAGLNGGNELIAKQLRTAALLDRGTFVAETVLAAVPADVRQLQQMVRLRQTALSDLEAAIKESPTTARAHLLIGELQSFPGGDRKRARQALDTAVRLSDGAAETKSRALLARSSLREDATKALADLDEAARLAPKSAKILRRRGAWRIENGQVEKALADLDAAIVLEPEHAATHRVRGTTLAILRRYDAAKKSFGKAIELEPRSISAYIQRGRIHVILSDGEAAAIDLSKALALRASPETLLLRASAYSLQKDDERAMKDVQTALKLRPGMPQALRARAMLLAGAGKITEAIVDLEQLKEEDKGAVLIQLGMLYSSNKQVDKAIDIFTTAIAKNANSDDAYRARADAFLRIGKHAKAKADYDATIRLQPEDTHVLNNLAWLLATSTDEKVRDGRRAIELATLACKLTEYKQAHIVSTLASGYAEIGDFPAAIKWSTKAVELGEGDIKQQLKKELQSYQAGRPWREKQTPEEE